MAVSLGSNLGDRAAHLDYAVGRLKDLLTSLRASTYRETAPVGTSTVQPMYLNAAVVGATDLPPRDLLEAFLDIERERGRERPAPGAPRTLDLDLVLYGDAIIDEPGLTVPHPRFRERLFVLQPLAEISPDLRDPMTGSTIAELVRNLITYSGFEF